MDLRPGQTLSVELIGNPRSAAAEKTLVRLFARDPVMARTQRRLKKSRPSWESWRRGGRQWHHQMKSHSPVQLLIGRQYTLQATLDVLRDLESVKKLVKVTAR
jgi:hypothetical protein